MDYIYVSKKTTENGNYENCIVNQIRDPSLHHLSVVSANMDMDNRVSSVEVNAINFKNLDPQAYNDTAALAREKSELSLYAVKETDEYNHPADLLSHDIRMYLE